MNLGLCNYIYLLQELLNQLIHDMSPNVPKSYLFLMDKLKQNFRILEIPVKYRARVGVSKITGTVSGTVKAGTKIIYTITKYLLT